MSGPVSTFSRSGPESTHRGLMPGNAPWNRRQCSTMALSDRPWGMSRVAAIRSGAVVTLASTRKPGG